MAAQINIDDIRQSIIDAPLAILAQPQLSFGANQEICNKNSNLLAD